MHPRTIFEGTILKRSNELLLHFIGEGADQVAYATGDPVTGEPAGSVLKFWKPHAFLEMGVLNHAFAVSDRWPDHPLRQSPAERAERLLDEMMVRIRSTTFVQRSEISRRMYTGAIQGLLHHVRGTLDISANAATEGTSPTERITAVLTDRLKCDLGLIRLLDVNLLRILEDIIDEDEIGDDARRICTIAFDLAQDRLQTDTIANNPLCNLLSLLDEGFIDHDELGEIAGSRVFIATIQAQHIPVLRDALRILYCIGMRQHHHLEQLVAQRSPMSEIQHEEHRLERATKLILTGAWLLAFAGERLGTLDSKSIEQARSWVADIKKIADTCVASDDPAFIIWDPYERRKASGGRFTRLIRTIFDPLRALLSGARAR